MRKTMQRIPALIIIGALLISLPCSTLGSEDTLPLTAREIAEKQQEKQFPKNSVMNMTMTLINKRGQERVRKLLIKRKDFGGGETKAIIVFLEPADVKGTTLLQWEHEDQPNDIFLYLPALKKVRRIASEQKQQSFMGSDFSYADFETGTVKDADHKILSDKETCDGEACWIVESIPKPDSDSEYSKLVAWVIKETYVPKKVEFYNKNNKLFKKMDILKTGPVGENIMPLHFVMENVKKNHKTEIVIDEILLNQDLPESAFTRRAMERQR